jgi:hypothetical protein
MRFRLSRLLCVALPATLLTACVSAPQAPANRPAAAAPLTLEASAISLPVSVDLARLGADLLRQLPRPFYSGSQTRSLPVRFSAMHTSYSMGPGTCSVTELNCLTRNSVRTVAADFVAPAEAVVSQQMFVRNIDISMEGSQFALTAEMEFTVNTRFKSDVAPQGVADCGDARSRPRFEIMLGGHVSWGAQGKPIITPRPYYVRWLQPCNITAFQMNAETVLNLPALRDKLQAAMEDGVFTRLRQVSLRTQLERAWTELNTPREIRPGVWLLPRPQRISFTELEGKGRQVSTSILVQAYPELVKGTRPAVVIPPLPEPEQGVNAGGGMHMAVRGDMALTMAQARLGRRLGAVPLQVKGEPVRIRQVRLYGHGDKAVLGLSLITPLLAEIHVLGRPVYDPENNEVHFEALEFSPQTRAYLARTANWLLDGDFLAALQAQAVLTFDETLAAALHDFRDLRVDAGQDMTLRGGVQRMQTHALHFTRDSLVAYVLVEGRLALESRQQLAQ